ncbi:hypothetical protein Tco_0326359, partial [Tanacetum coccineum]
PEPALVDENEEPEEEEEFEDEEEFEEEEPQEEEEDIVEERVTALENLVRKFGNAKEREECKKLKKELEEAGLSNTLLRMQKERVERDLY